MERREYPDGTEIAGIYVRAVRVGPFVYVSGTTALDRAGRIVGADAAGQTAATMAKITAALTSAGATMDDLVRLTIYCTDIADAPAILAALERFYGRARPAATLLGVSALARPGLLVEIQADAVRPQSAASGETPNSQG